MADGTHDKIRSDPTLWLAYVENDHKLPPQYAQFTRAGVLLRRLSLDELPQLINIVQGDMSLVGVRPVEQTQLDFRPEASQRLYKVLRPGLTGLWQVEGRSAVEHPDRVALDDRYVLSQSLLTDIKLLCRTPLAVWRMRDFV